MKRDSKILLGLEEECHGNKSFEMGGPMWSLGVQKLTQQYDDTDKDCYDGSSSQSSGNDSLHVHAVSMVITLADFDPQMGSVRHRKVTRVCDHDGNLIDSTGQGADL